MVVHRRRLTCTTSRSMREYVSLATRNISRSVLQKVSVGHGVSVIILSGNGLCYADETDGGSKNSSPKPPKKQDSAPAGVLNVSILHCYDNHLASS